MEDRAKAIAEIERLRGLLKKWEGLLAAYDDPEIAKVLEPKPVKFRVIKVKKEKTAVLRKTKIRPKNQRDKMLDAIDEAGRGLTVREIVDATGIPENAVRSLFSQHPRSFTSEVGPDGLKRWAGADGATKNEASTA